MLVLHALRTLLWTGLGVGALWASADLGPWVGGAFAALFFGKAALAGFQLAGLLTGETKLASFTRGFRAMAVGYIVAACVIGAGALWQRSVFGFLVAYGAFSFAWVMLWARRAMPSKSGSS